MIRPLPDLTRPAADGEGLVCGWDDTLPGVALPCGAPAAHHIRLTPRTAVLLCQPHADLVTAAHVYLTRHPARDACAAPGHTWGDHGCTTQE